MKHKTFYIAAVLLLTANFLLPTTFYSQKSEETPIFVLQGTVKLKGKPIEGASLELTKDGKKITGLITRKNGLYSFQMNKSNTDKESVYLLNILKEGTLNGILTINTYTPKEEFDYLPYIFNLDINLILPSVPDIVKHDFGKIKWDAEPGVFDFDKEYAMAVEKDKEVVKTDSSTFLKEVAAIIKEDTVEEKKESAIGNEQLANKKELTTGNEALANKKELAVGNEQLENKKELAVGNEQVANKKELAVDKEQVANKKEPAIDYEWQLFQEQLANKKELAVGNEQLANKKELAVGNEQLANKKELAVGNEQLANKKEPAISKEQVANKKELAVGKEQVANKKESTIRKEQLANKKEPAISKEQLANKKESEIGKEQLANKKESTIRKEQLANKKELTVGNKQWATNNQQPTTNNQQPTTIYSGDIVQNSFDGTKVFSINNEKSKLLNVKAQMERKKAANLAKKYETNNILTSLLDVVEEYDNK